MPEDKKDKISQIIGDLLGSAIIDQTKFVTETKEDIVDDVNDLFIREIYGFTDGTEAGGAEYVDITNYIKENWELYRENYIRTKDEDEEEDVLHEIVKTDNSGQKYCPKKEVKSTQIKSVTRKKIINPPNDNLLNNNCTYEINIIYDDDQQNFNYKYTSIFLNRDIIDLRDALNNPVSQTTLKSQIENFVKPLFENTGSRKSGDSTKTIDKKPEESVKSVKSKNLAGDPGDPPGYSEGNEDPKENQKIIEEVKYAEYIISDPGTQSIFKMITDKTSTEPSYTNFKGDFYRRLFSR